MAYDASKDVTLVEMEDPDLGLVVYVSRYAGGEPKVGIQRFYLTRGGERRWSKLGRLGLREAEFVSASIAQILTAPAVVAAARKSNG